jgi:hypothetical protein
MMTEMPLEPNSDPANRHSQGQDADAPVPSRPAHSPVVPQTQVTPSESADAFPPGSARSKSNVDPPSTSRANSAAAAKNARPENGQGKPREAASRPVPPKPPRKVRQRVALPAIDSSESPVDLTRWQTCLTYLPPRRTVTSFLCSTLLHVIMLVVLTLIIVAPQKENGILTVEVGIDDSSPVTLKMDSTQRVQLQSVQSLSNFEVSTEVDIPLPQAPIVGVQASQPKSEQATISTAADLKAFSNLPTGGGMSGRAEEQRNELVVSEGGTESSERAVELGLAWLAAHQRENGAWWFNFHDSECGGRCRHPGSVGSSTAATGLALLCFLGRGETPSQGKYQEVVQRGLYYLQNRMVFTKYGGDLQEGTMYGHAIATLALCEAYGMTQDAALRPLAQKAVDYIVHAQHEKGGWRYTPKQPGDTTVTGWQVMALRSAHLAGLEVPTPTTEMVKLYLDSVQTHAGSRYKYLVTDEEETPVPSAVGLLCRMYLGWSRDTTPLREGARYLSELGPSTSDLYFDYYATQVLHHFGTPYWDGWNRLMRDYLISNQAIAGHEKGSWHFSDEHGDQGGRLYSTAMAVMILEVYYRYLPLYESRAVDFPL